MQYCKLLFIFCFYTVWVSAHDRLYVHSVSYHGAQSIERAELQYLSGITSGMFVTQQDIKNALFYIQQKQSVKSVHVDTQQVDDEEGVHLVFTCVLQPVVTSVKVTGLLMGKDTYKHMYLMVPGDPFDNEQHDLSLQNIRKDLYNRGFLQATVTGKVVYNASKTQASIEIHVNRGPQFAVRDIQFTFLAKQGDKHAEHKELAAVLEKMFARRLWKHKATDTTIKKIEKKVQRLLQTKGYLYETLHIEPHIIENTTQVRLECTIVLDRKKAFVFFGNHFFSRKDLLDELLVYGPSSWHLPGGIVQEEIEQLYKKKGFWHVEVQTRDEQGRLFCLIKEGKRAVITDVLYKDCPSLSPVELKKCMKPVVKKGLYDQELVDSCLASCLELYARKGYWQAQVVKKDFIPVGKDQYKLVVTFDEKKQQFLERVQIEEYPDLEKHTFFAYINAADESIPFDKQYIAQQRLWLVQYFKQQGFTSIRVMYHIEKQEDNAVRLVWRIEKKDHAMTFGKTVIRGNTHVPFSCLQQELAYATGQVWHKEALEKTAQNLRTISIFDTVQLYPLQHKDEAGHRPVCLYINDVSQYEFRTRIGLAQVGRDLHFRQGFTYKLGASLFVNNPLQRGDRFGTEVDITRFYRNFNIRYMMPWLLQQPIRTELKIYDNHYKQPLFLGSNISLYDATQQGGMVGFHRHYKELDIGLNFGAEFMGVRQGDVELISDALLYDQDLWDTKSLFLFCEPTLLWERLDSIYKPTKGHRSLLSSKMMIDLATKSSFVKVLGEHVFYTPLPKQAVLGVRMRVGHIFNRSFERIIPFERFFLGGANSIRGYERDYCPPLGLLQKPVSIDNAGLPEEAKSVWRYVPQGGRTMMMVNAEIRLPVYKNFDVAVFSDLGALFQGGVKDVKNAILGGTGFGFRVNTPIGALRFDCAFKWKRLYHDFEHLFMWYFALGQAF